MFTVSLVCGVLQKRCWVWAQRQPNAECVQMSESMTTVWATNNFYSMRQLNWEIRSWLLSETRRYISALLSSFSMLFTMLLTVLHRNIYILSQSVSHPLIHSILLHIVCLQCIYSVRTVKWANHGKFWFCRIGNFGTKAHLDVRIFMAFFVVLFIAVVHLCFNAFSPSSPCSDNGSQSCQQEERDKNKWTQQKNR